MRIGRSGLRMAALSLLLGAGLSFGQTMQERLDFADGLYHRGMYDLAIKEYLLLSREEGDALPRNRILYQIGECFRALGNREAAEAYFRRLAGTIPEQEFGARAAFRLGEMALKENRSAEAMPLFDAALRAASVLPRDLVDALHLMRARSLLASGNADEAEAVLLRLLDASPDSPLAAAAAFEAAELIGKAGGREDLEERLYRRVALLREGEEDGDEAWLRIADLSFRIGRYAQAADAADALFRRAPGSARARAARRLAAWATLLSNRWADTVALTEQALADTTGGDRAEWLYLAGNARRQLKDPARALAAYDELTSQHPESEFAESAGYEAALVAHQSGDAESAIQRALRLRPEGPLRGDVDWLLAEAFQSLGRTDEAIQRYRAVLTGPSSSRGIDAAFRLGGILRDRGLWMDAAAVFNAASERPDAGDSETQARHAAAYCLSRAERHEEAMVKWSRILRETPGHPLAEDTWFRKALSEMALGQSVAASESLRHLLETWPESAHRAEARYWRGILLERDGHRDMAEREYRTALRAQPRETLEGLLRLRLAGVVRALNRQDEAADLFQGLLGTTAESELSAPILRWLVERQVQRGKMDEAEKIAERLIARGQKENPAWAFTGWYWMGRIRRPRDANAAIEAYDKASQSPGMSRETVDAFVQSGEIHLEAGRPREARVRFSEAVERTTGSELGDLRVRALFGLGRTSLAINELQEAVRYFQKVAFLFDDPYYSPRAFQQAASVLRTLERDADAETLLREMRERYPEPPGG